MARWSPESFLCATLWRCRAVLVVCGCFLPVLVRLIYSQSSSLLLLVLYYLFLLLVWVGGFTGNQGQKVGGFTGNQGQKVGGFTVDNWSESPLPVDKPRSGNRLGSPRNSFQQADGYKPSAARPGPHSGA